VVFIGLQRNPPENPPETAPSRSARQESRPIPASQLSPGARTVCYVDPRYPSQAVLNPDLPAIQVLGMIVAAGLPLVLLVGGILVAKSSGAPRQSG